MKKVIAVLLMIFTVAVLFAETDTVKVSAIIDGSSSAHFASNEAGAVVSGDGVSFSDDISSTDSDAKATVYVYGTTNKTDAFSVEIFGTALTRVVSNDSNNSLTDETIGITVTWSDPDAAESIQSDTSKDFDTAATTNSSNGVAGSPGEGLTVPVCAEGIGQRSDAKLLTIKVTNTNAAAKATAGTYWAYLTMVYSAQ